MYYEMVPDRKIFELLLVGGKIKVWPELWACQNSNSIEKYLEHNRVIKNA